MNINIERNLVINGARDLILESTLGHQCLECITIKNSRNIIISGISYLKRLSVEYCNDITISGCVIDFVDIIVTKKHSFIFNVIKHLNIDKLSSGIVSNNKVIT